jgi:hypothetical protein
MIMKITGIIFGLLIISSMACRAPRESIAHDGGTNDTINGIVAKTESDSVKYDLVIFDPDFDAWVTMHAMPIGSYSQQYLEQWNAILANQWNSAGMGTGRLDCRPTTYLDYNPGTDYGKELNYKLFNYFRFMHERCRIFTNRPGEWRR